MKRFLGRLLDSLVQEKRLVKFSNRWLELQGQKPEPANIFFCNVNSSEIQFLFGLSNPITDIVTVSSMILLSPKKLVELRDMLNTVIVQYESKFGPITEPPVDPSTTPPIVH